MGKKGQSTERYQQYRRYGWPLCVFLSLVLFSTPGQADDLVIKINGLTESLHKQVSNRVDSFGIKGGPRLTPRRLQKIVGNVEKEASRALRPFGYYHAQVTSTLTAAAENSWRLELEVTPGPPVIVTASTIEVVGEGADLPALREWKRNWPLTVGQRLDQTVWDAKKQSAIDLAQAVGYFNAEFTQHTLVVDLDRNEASTTLVLDTGARAVMGEVRFKQDVLKPGILELLPSFKAGQPYDSVLLEKFRLDIWRTGYFEDVEIIEERRLEERPPRVNFVVNAKARKPNTYQGSLGFGTDTLIRAQVAWNRHLLSSRGDSLSMGLGWQQQFDEYSFKSTYRLPRRAKAREFWTADLFVRRKTEDLKVKANDTDSDYVKLTNGEVFDYSVKLGKLIVRDRERGYQQLFETWYWQYLLEKKTFSLRDLAAGNFDEIDLGTDLRSYRDVDSSYSLGVNWDLPVVRGSGFSTTGHHERAWVFTANKLWGSAKDFTQAYVSSSWHRLLGDSWKLLLRGEVGYSKADVSELEVHLAEKILRLSVTDLPNLYRFKAGGARSVRGYGFEDLSNNGIGSNNIVTGSAEVEWSVRPDWSLAAFYDVGNAFNNWSNAQLKRGAGLGVRWYSIVGPVRVDVAQALDIAGKPWQLHITVGTPLL